MNAKACSCVIAAYVKEVAETKERAAAKASRLSSLPSRTNIAPFRRSNLLRPLRAAGIGHAGIVIDMLSICSILNSEGLRFLPL
jgi:hypothetical protein